MVCINSLCSVDRTDINSTHIHSATVTGDKSVGDVIAGYYLPKSLHVGHGPGDTHSAASPS